jgi:HK97 family phage major capsid protein
MDFRSTEELLDRRQELMTQLDRASGERAQNIRASLESVNGLLATKGAYEDRMRQLAANPAATASGDGSRLPSSGPFAPRAPAAVPPLLAGRETREQNRDHALRCIEDHSNQLSAQAADRLESLVRRDLLGGDSAYLRGVASDDYGEAFGLWLKHGPASASYHMTDAQRDSIRAVVQAEAMRAMAGGGMQAAAPGVSVGGSSLPLPLTIDPSIQLSNDGAISPLRELARTLTISTNEWVGITSSGVLSGYSEEASDVTGGTPSFEAPAVKAERWTSFVPFSFEIQEDFASVQTQLAVAMSDSKDVLDATMLLSGSGTLQPEGILTGLGTAVAVATSGGTAVVDDIYEVKSALGPRFRPNATWVMSGPVIDEFNRMAPPGSTTEPPLLSADRQSLLGRPLRELSTMDDDISEAGAKIALYADFKKCFVVVDRLGIRVEVVNHLFNPDSGLPTGRRGLLAYGRTGAGVVMEEAARVLQVKT